MQTYTPGNATLNPATVTTSPAYATLGPTAATASTKDQLYSEPVVCGTGDPTHTPALATQQYTNTTSGQRWTRIGGAWIRG